MGDAIAFCRFVRLYTLSMPNTNGASARTVRDLANITAGFGEQAFRDPVTKKTAMAKISAMLAKVQQVLADPNLAVLLAPEKARRLFQAPLKPPAAKQPAAARPADVSRKTGCGNCLHQCLALAQASRAQIEKIREVCRFNFVSMQFSEERLE